MAPFRAPPVITSDFIYLRFIGDRSIRARIWQDSEGQNRRNGILGGGIQTGNQVSEKRRCRCQQSLCWFWSRHHYALYENVRHRKARRSWIYRRLALERTASLSPYLCRFYLPFFVQNSGLLIVGQLRHEEPVLATFKCTNNKLTSTIMSIVSILMESR